MVDIGCSHILSTIKRQIIVGCIICDHNQNIRPHLFLPLIQLRNHWHINLFCCQCPSQRLIPIQTAFRKRRLYIAGIQLATYKYVLLVIPSSTEDPLQFRKHSVGLIIACNNAQYTFDEIGWMYWAYCYAIMYLESKHWKKMPSLASISYFFGHQNIKRTLPEDSGFLLFI